MNDDLTQEDVINWGDSTWFEYEVLSITGKTSISPLIIEASLNGLYRVTFSSKICYIGVDIEAAVNEFNQIKNAREDK